MKKFKQFLNKEFEKETAYNKKIDEVCKFLTKYEFKIENQDHGPGELVTKASFTGSKNTLKAILLDYLKQPNFPDKEVVDAFVKRTFKRVKKAEEVYNIFPASEIVAMKCTLYFMYGVEVGIFIKLITNRGRIISI